MSRPNQHPSSINSSTRTLSPQLNAFVSSSLLVGILSVLLLVLLLGKDTSPVNINNYTSANNYDTNDNSDNRVSSSSSSRLENEERQFLVGQDTQSVNVAFTFSFLNASEPQNERAEFEERADGNEAEENRENEKSEGDVGQLGQGEKEERNSTLLPVLVAEENSGDLTGSEFETTSNERSVLEGKPERTMENETASHTRGNDRVSSSPTFHSPSLSFSPFPVAAIIRGELGDRLFSLCASRSLSRIFRSPLHAIWLKDEYLPRTEFSELFDQMKWEEPSTDLFFSWVEEKIEQEKESEGGRVSEGGWWAPSTVVSHEFGEIKRDGERKEERGAEEVGTGNRWGTLRSHVRSWALGGSEREGGEGEREQDEKEGEEEMVEMELIVWPWRDKDTIAFELKRSEEAGKGVGQKTRGTGDGEKPFPNSYPRLSLFLSSSHPLLRTGPNKKGQFLFKEEREREVGRNESLSFPSSLFSPLLSRCYSTLLHPSLAVKEMVEEEMEEKEREGEGENGQLQNPSGRKQRVEESTAGVYVQDNSRFPCSGCYRHESLNCTVRLLSLAFLRNPHTVDFVVSGYWATHARALSLSYHANRSPLLPLSAERRLRECGEEERGVSEMKRAPPSLQERQRGKRRRLAEVAGERSGSGVRVGEKKRMRSSVCMQLELSELFLLSLLPNLHRTFDSPVTDFILGKIKWRAMGRREEEAGRGDEKVEGQEMSVGGIGGRRRSLLDKNSLQVSSPPPLFSPFPSICASRRQPPITEWVAAKHFIVQEDLRLAYCNIPKVACSSFKLWLKYFQGNAYLFEERRKEENETSENGVESKGKSEGMRATRRRRRRSLLVSPSPSLSPHTSVLHSPQASGLSELWYSYSEPEAHFILTRKDVWKFVLVRNPFQRLLSAYLDKHRFAAESGPYSRAYWMKTFFNRLGRVPQLKRGEFLPFPRFASLVISLMKTKRWIMDHHIAPQVDLCGLQRIEYDLVGRFESLPLSLASLTQKLFPGFNLTRHMLTEREEVSAGEGEREREGSTIANVSLMHELGRRRVKREEMMALLREAREKHSVEPVRRTEEGRTWEEGREREGGDEGSGGENSKRGIHSLSLSPLDELVLGSLNAFSLGRAMHETSANDKVVQAYDNATYSQVLDAFSCDMKISLNGIDYEPPDELRKVYGTPVSL